MRWWEVVAASTVTERALQTASASLLAAGCPCMRSASAMMICLGGTLGAKRRDRVLRLAFWLGQDCDVVEYLRSCQKCRHTKAEHGSPRGLPHSMIPLPEAGLVDWGGGWITGLQTTAAASTCCKARCIPSQRARRRRRLATATVAAAIIRDM